MSGLVLDHLTIRRDGQAMLSLDLTVPPGSVVTLMGPSGVGKSTLVAAIAGFLEPPFTLEGHITCDGIDLAGLAPQARRLGVMFQDALLFPHLSVGGNIAYGLPPGGSRAERKRRVADLLDQAGLPGFADRDPARLSGGERARVALMRLLAAEPRALLLDEPFSRLDPPLRRTIRALTFGLARERGLPTLLVTHDGGDAEDAGGPVIHLQSLLDF
jgi:putative thiamine transport system ATP-binding protein